MTAELWRDENRLWPTMTGRVYSWNGGWWRVLARWRGAGPRNVLIENVTTGERTVRPARGLRKP